MNEEDYCEAFSAVQQAMNGYDPSVIGYAWDNSNPHIQLEPRGTRGYIELRAIIKDLAFKGSTENVPPLSTYEFYLTHFPHKG